jgi:hypothetical protein
MTIQEAMAEIDRKHPGIVDAWQDRKRHKTLKPKCQYSYWFFTWTRDQYGSMIIVESLDDKWQVL